MDDYDTDKKAASDLRIEKAENKYFLALIKELAAEQYKKLPPSKKKSLNFLPLHIALQQGSIPQGELLYKTLVLLLIEKYRRREYNEIENEIIELNQSAYRPTPPKSNANHRNLRICLKYEFEFLASGNVQDAELAAQKGEEKISLKELRSDKSRWTDDVMYEKWRCLKTYIQIGNKQKVPLPTIKTTIDDISGLPLERIEKLRPLVENGSIFAHPDK